MFTGIVRELGVVVGSRRPTAASARRARARDGGSTASATRLRSTAAASRRPRSSDGAITFHAVPETSRDDARRLEPDDGSNVEPALRAGEQLGGHYVQGHVDAVGRMQSVEAEGEGLRVFVEAPDDVLRYCVEKGSITVDGVSLTVAELADDAFAVALVPHTLAATTLSDARAGPGGQPRGRRAREVRRAVCSRAEGYDPGVTVDLRPPETASPFATIEEAIEDIRSGRFVVVVDDADRENEGDLTIAAQFVTPEAITFMATHGRGLICLCLTPERCDELELRPMTEHNETPLGTAFTVSIEAREGVSTGISAHDRARTIQVAIDPQLHAARPRPARPRLPAPREAGRRAPARGPDRGGGRPRAARRASTPPASSARS